MLIFYCLLFLKDDKTCGLEIQKYKGVSGMLIMFVIWVLVTQMYSVCENTISNIVIMCAL